MVFALLGRSNEAGILRRLLAVEVTHAPHLIDAEIGSALRRLVHRGELAPLDAQALLSAAEPLIDHRHAMNGVLARAAWRLRNNLSFYDALYAALADALRTTLVTADERLSRAGGLPCAVRLVGPA
jgi:predicted nucleic acid-binding protein